MVNLARPCVPTGSGVTVDGVAGTLDDLIKGQLGDIVGVRSMEEVTLEYEEGEIAKVPDDESEDRAALNRLATIQALREIRERIAEIPEDERQQPVTGDLSTLIEELNSYLSQ